MIASLLHDAPQSTQTLFGRLPGSKAEQDCHVDPIYVIPVPERGKTAQSWKCMLITTSSYETDARKCYPALLWTSPPHQIMADEAQSFCLPIHAIPLAADKKDKARLRTHWGIVYLGDPFQPHGASPAPHMQLVLAELFRRAPGIRHPDVRFLPPSEFLTELKNAPALPDDPRLLTSSCLANAQLEVGDGNAKITCEALINTVAALLR